MADDSILGELVPVDPQELLTRGAVGAPGRLRIEVGLAEPRFARPEGQRTPRKELALQRALGGVSYPADRKQVIAGAGRWLGGHEELRERLAGLPDLIYGGELEVLRRLEEPPTEHPEPTPGISAAQSFEAVPDSAGLGKEEGSAANR
ncbi:MAG TPA: hypothetical protein VNF24_09915 [Candidatus Acidoferrales bacterium]|nr:hypothetical protein [Candidatus Acidoferrales bacterium]